MNTHTTLKKTLLAAAIAGALALPTAAFADVMTGSGDAATTYNAVMNAKHAAAPVPAPALGGSGDAADTNRAVMDSKDGSPVYVPVTQDSSDAVDTNRAVDDSRDSGSPDAQ
jgi:hypothetical protein